MGKLGHFAFRRKRFLAIAAVAVAVVAALGGSTVYDNVKPFGFQDPNSDSSRALDTLRDATGVRPIPEVELLVAPADGAPGPAAAVAAQDLRSVSGVARVVTPVEDPALLSIDGRKALVLGFLSSDVDDISQVGADVKDRFAVPRRTRIFQQAPQAGRALGSPPQWGSWGSSRSAERGS